MSRYKEEKAVFRKTFRGYDKDAVDGFIGGMNRQIAELEEEIDSLKSKLKASNETVEKYKRNDEYRRDIIAEAKSEAERIVSDAKGRAAKVIIRTGRQCNRIVSDMVSQVEEQKNIYETAKREVAKFRSDLFAMYSDHVKKINALSEAAGVFDDGASHVGELENITKMLGDEIPDEDELNEAEEKLEKVNIAKRSPEHEKEADPEFKFEDKTEDIPDEDANEFELTPEPFGKDEPEKLEIDAEDLDEFGKEGPRTDVVNEFDGGVSIDEVFGKSYDSDDFEAEYSGEKVKEKAPAPTPEEILEKRLRAEDDSNEFYTEDDDEYAGDVNDAPTTEITIVRESDILPRKKKRWKLKRSITITDEFRAAKEDKKDEN